MNDFQSRVAVITGAASGIGRAIAAKCAAEGMRLALADIEEPALRTAAAELKSAGAQVLAVRTDVSKYNDVAALADRAYSEFGAVHLLFNNAGVGAGGTVWETGLEDWSWVLGVNLWGVVHGVRAFTQRMIAQGDDCRIVNTASMAGLLSSPGLGAYAAAKHAVIALSETLSQELALVTERVKVAVLCPAYVKTRIMDSQRNRPADHAPAARISSEILDARRQAVENGIPPEQVADTVFQALREERFYIYTHPDWMPLVELRQQDILLGRNPANLYARAKELTQK